MEFQVSITAIVRNLKFKRMAKQPFYNIVSMKELYGSCILKSEKIEGRGVASTLAHFGLEWAKENNMKAKVLCPFVATYLKRHPEYNQYVTQ